MLFVFNFHRNTSVTLCFIQSLIHSNTMHYAFRLIFILLLYSAPLAYFHPSTIHYALVTNFYPNIIHYGLSTSFHLLLIGLFFGLISIPILYTMLSG